MEQNMLTPRENFLETIKPDGKPDRLVSGYEPIKMILPDPVIAYERGGIAKNIVSVDPFGVSYIWPEDQPAAVPYHTEENKVIKDITRWKDVVNFPDLRVHATDWEVALSVDANIDRTQYLATVLLGTGLFERMHGLMGFEDALMNMYLEPEAYADVLDLFLEERLTAAELLIDNLHPDAVLSHDDWGMKTSLFMSPEVWREFFKPRYKTLYDYFHSRGVVVIHHADSFLEPIVTDMAEIGIDVWQGVLTTNDIPKLQRELAGSMTLMGGMDTANMDRDEATEDEIRSEARNACETYGAGGHFIPCNTYGVPGDVFHALIDALSAEEVAKYNEKTYGVFA
jgi:hypothetical protein